MISAETVEATWRRIGGMSPGEAQELGRQMQAEQPYITAYLLAVGEAMFTPHETGILFYAGTVTWQMLCQGPKRPRRVTRKKMDAAAKANDEFLELLFSDTEGDFDSAARASVEQHPEREVLRYIVEALMEDDPDRSPDDPQIRDEYRGIAFVYLKSVLDALVASMPG